MTFSVRLDELDAVLVKKYAAFKKETVSGLVRKVLMQTIERDFRRLEGGDELKKYTSFD